MLRIVLALFCLVVGCKEPSDQAGPWTRTQWLAVANELAIKVGVGSGLEDRASRDAFAKLVTTESWHDLDGSSFGRDTELLQFFPTYKRLYIAIGIHGSTADLTSLSLFGLEVYDSFIRAGMEFVEHLPDGDPTKKTRLDGFEKVRLGAAIELCTLLYASQDASYAGDIARSKLTAAKTYASHSREGLQLIIATLDEKVLPTISPSLRASYQAIRDVVAREYDAREARPLPTRTTYQGLPPPVLKVPRALTVVSKSGGFSVGFGVALGMEPLAKRIEIQHVGGTPTVEHWITHEVDGTTFEAACFDQMSESDIAARFEGTDGVSTRPVSQPGKTFAFKTSSREGRIRVTTIGTRGCLASAESAAGRLPTALADSFVASLRASSQ